MSARITILGTGRMGSALARRLAHAGFPLTLWNRSRGKAESVGRVAETPAAAVRDADVVLSILTDARAVRDVYTGPDGALTAALGQRFVEMSTAGPEIVEELAPAVRATGSSLVDAPVLGTVTTIESGTLLVLVGGDGADVDGVRPVLGPLGEVHHVGPLGSGARLKLVANSMLAISNAAAAELLAAGTAVGLERERVFWVLARLAPSLRAREAAYLTRRYEPPLFALRDMLKDVDLGLTEYHRAQATTPLVALTRELFAEAAHTDGDRDLAAIARRYERA